MVPSETCSMFLCHGPLFSGIGSRSTPSSLAAVDSAHPPRLLLPVSCKMRQRNLSSKAKRQQTRKGRPDRSPLRDDIINGDASTSKVQNAPDDCVSSSQLGTSLSSVVASSAGINVDAQGVDNSSSLGERHIAEEVPGEEPVQRIAIDDLTAMIKNAEKNILLLNQARISALEDLDNILVEKKGLHAEINRLEIELSEIGTRNKVSVEEKMDMNGFEGQVDEAKEEISSGKSFMKMERSKHFNADGTFTDIDFLSLNEELCSLREENMSLKDDINILKKKLSDIKSADERVLLIEEKHSFLESAVKEQESDATDSVSKLATLENECSNLRRKVENLQMLLDSTTKQADQVAELLQKNEELQRKVEKLESFLKEENGYKISLESTKKHNELLQQKVEILEERLQISDQEIDSHIELYQASVKEFQETLSSLKEESKKRSVQLTSDDMPWKFWSHLLLTLDGWFLEKKISIDDAKLLREMARKRDVRIRDAYIACKDKSDNEAVTILLNLTKSLKSSGLHIVHIAAEMAPVAKVGGLGDVVSGLSKALQKRGHLVEIILPKYDCMNHDLISDLKELDMTVHSYFDGQQFGNKIWVGIVAGLPVYFIEPHHPGKFFWRGQYYGEHDDFKRFSFFSRAALELLFQSGKKPDIIHCHDWQTAFVPPLYWDVYSSKGFNSARICFTCHNFEYQGVSPASELASCGLDVHHLHRPDRMQDNSSHERINPVKGAVVYSNIVTTVSPTYAQEVRTAEGGRGLHETLNFHSRKFVGILNGIDTDAWNPATDSFLKYQYSADDLQAKEENKAAVRKHLGLSSANASQPLVCCITRLVPQKGVHLIRHAIYQTLELGGQFILLGSSPVTHIQREFEEISNHFQNHPHVRLILSYDDALSHAIFAASDMFVIPSIFEPCGLTQMIAMRYGSVPIARRTGGLNDSVFDVDDDAIPVQVRNGFTFLVPDEQGLSGAMKRGFKLYMRNPDAWRDLVQKNMAIDFSWDSSSAQYEQLYENSLARARKSSRENDS
ncbi:unnamed protein product [Spirodela intermedia]|uniref:starch synthase n=1 Tax=Spirodela intermedia TaxID=51605 RepID=A0A7I8KKI1_SPIIN|nr:unnamed protein product [Spirodela intermedia]